MIVVDASAFIDALLFVECGENLSITLSQSQLSVPEHFTIEVLQSIRKLERLDLITSETALSFVTTLSRLNCERVATNDLVDSIWDLRHNFTSYDGAYVALAKRLMCPLFTHDTRLANAAANQIVIRNLRPAP